MASLQVLAKAALAAAAEGARRRDAAHLAAAHELYTRLFAQDFGVPLPAVGGRCDARLPRLVYVDGLVLYREQAGWYRLGTCAACSQPVWSEVFGDLAGLGAMIQGFRPATHWARVHELCGGVIQPLCHETLARRLCTSEVLAQAVAFALANEEYSWAVDLPGLEPDAEPAVA